MSINFDWNREDEDRRKRQAADDHFQDVQTLKRNRVRNAILGFIGTAVLVWLLVAIRQAAYDRQLQTELEQTVAAETSAIRTGDESAFLGIQKNIAGWPALQDRVFIDYRQRGDRLIAVGEITNLSIAKMQAHVILQEVLDGKPYEVVWFYEYNGSAWKHVPPQVDYWGKQTGLTGNHVTLTAPALDRDQAAAIQTQMEDWWQTACRLTRCGSTGPKPVTVKLEFDLDLKPRWSPDDPSVLEMPSPHLGRVPVDSSLNPETRQTLAVLLAGYWARLVVGEVDDPDRRISWFRDELAAWLAGQFGAQADAPLLGPLARQHGSDAIMRLYERLSAGDDVIPALRSVTGGDPAADDTLGWQSYLAHRLSAETAQIAAGKATEWVFRDPEREKPVAVIGSDWLAVAPESIRVVGTERSGDLLWADARFSLTNKAEDQKSVLASYEPFRVVSDRWVHTAVLPADFGAVHEDHSAHVILRYTDLDALAASGLAADIERAYVGAAADLGIPADRISGLEVEVTLSQPRDDPWLADTPNAHTPPGPPVALKLMVVSPHLSIRLGNQGAQDALRAAITRDMLIRMVRYHATTLNPRSPLTLAIARWEAARLGRDPNALLPIMAASERVSYDTLERLWQRSQAGPYMLEDHIAARTLIELLVKQRGPEAIRALLPALASATSMDDWLARSLTMKASDIEAQWASSTMLEITKAR